jgi:pimeloyl-ACP methyl ester carboxylesterase
MKQQASNLQQLLIEEHIKSVLIIAHSMGGAVAIELIEKLALNKQINVKGIVILEGNLDENDTFYSSKIATRSFEEYKNKTKNKKNAFSLWASSVDLVKVSKKHYLLPKLMKFLDFPAYFMFGAANKGRYTSEKLIENNGLQLIYIPKAGHFIHKENPKSFWSKIKDLFPPHKTDRIKMDSR